MGVEQRATGVAGIDRGVGLDGVLNAIARGKLDGADGRDHAAGHGAGETEGVADGVDLLADEEVRGVSERYWLKVCGAGDLEQSDVVDRVDADALCLVLLLVPEGHLDGLRVVDHVVVGEDMSLIINNKARSLTLLGNWP